MVGRPAAALLMGDDQRGVLERIAVSTSVPHRAVRQAEALLCAADGVGNEEIGRRVGVSANTVRAWRHRFAERGLDRFGDILPGRGPKSELPVAEVVRATMMDTPPDGGTHWTTRLMAAHMGIGKDSVAKIWRDNRLKPWKIDTFKLSSDPRFEEKLADVVGLYLHPPERAVVFSFDEKPTCQALDRTQPSLPLRRGRSATMTHDYKRHGTTDLFAALNIGTGEVITQCRASHTGADVLAFFKRIDKAVPRSKDIHVVLDNLSAHKAPEVTEWLAHPRRARWHLHFTPTSSSWLNLVERWFKELTDRRLRRGVFSSVADLIAAISDWATRWNDNPRPFIWTKTAEEISEKVSRGRKTLSQVKGATEHYYKPGSLKATLCRDGNRSMMAFCEEHAIPHEQCGKLIVATTATEESNRPISSRRRTCGCR